MIALVFLYAIAATFIYGGEVNAVMLGASEAKTPCPPDPNEPAEPPKGDMGT